MWCDHCKHETPHRICELCGKETNVEPSTVIHWCNKCNIPLIHMENDFNIDTCPLCGENTTYLVTDLRPVFPEERLLIEILLEKPLSYLHDSVWANNNRYYVKP